MEALKKLVDQNIEEMKQKGLAVIDVRETEEIKEIADKISCGIILVSESRLKALIKSYIEKLADQHEIIKLLLYKLTDLAKEQVEKSIGVSEENENKQFLENAVDSLTWDYFFDAEDRRKIIDYIISEDKSKKMY